MKTTFIILILVCIGGSLQAQVGINTTSPNAVLDVNSSNQATPSNTDGILIPKIDEFPVTTPTTAQDGMLVFVTGSGTPSRGFYYWDQGTSSWVLLTGGSGTSEWTDQGNYLVPADGNTEDVTIGGADNANSKLTVVSEKSIGTYIDAQSTQNTKLAGLSNVTTNATTNATAQTIGGEFVISSGNDGTLKGTTSTLINAGNATLIGNENILSSNGTGLQTGSLNSITGTGDGTIRGTVNNLAISSGATQTGIENNLTNGAEGIRTGTANNLSGNANGPEYGTNTTISTTTTAIAPNYGSLVTLSGTGEGDRYGYSGFLQGAGDGIRYGTEIQISNGGSGIHYGNYNLLSGAGSGNKYGTYNFLAPSAGGTHYGVYSEALKTGSYAGYFLGNVAIGTTTANTYILPASRGTNGQIMQTDGSGNVSWTTPTSGSEWTDNVTYLSPADGDAEDVTIGGADNTNAKLTVRSDKLLGILYTNTTQKSTSSIGLNTYLENNSTNSGAYSLGVYNDVVQDGLGGGMGVWNNIRGATGNYIYAVLNRVSGSGNGLRSGVQNEISGTGDGQQNGTYNYVSNSGDGTHYGTYTTLSGNGLGLHYGGYHTLSGSGSGNQYGLYQAISNTGDGEHYGISNEIFGIGTGVHYGVQNRLYGSGSGNQIGVNNSITNSGNGNHTGTINSFQGGGSGFHIGNSNNFLGSATGVQTAVSNYIDVSGNSPHYGIYNTLRGSGSGDKYGSYTTIIPTAGGTHYGIYSDVLKSGSYAGYFLGNVAIGTNTVNTYTFPSSRGANGQVMQTDGSGNLSWATPLTSDTSPAWYDEGTTTNATSTSSDIIRSGNVGLGVTNANYTLDVYDQRGVTMVNIAMDDNSNFSNTDSHGIKMVIDNDNGSLSTGDTYAIENTVSVLTGDGYGIKNTVLSHSGASPTVYGSYQNIIGNAVGSAIGYGTYNKVDDKFSTAYGSYNEILSPGFGVYSKATNTGSFAGYFLGTVAIGTNTSNIYSFPSFRGSNNQVMLSNGSGVLSWVDGSTLGAQKIDDLSDGKSDSDGSNDGSSLFIGVSAGGQDDSTDNKNVGIGYYASYSNASGENNVAIGYQARQLSVAGNGNVAIGKNAGYNNWGNDNVTIGRDSGPRGYDTASDNISIGASAGSGLGVMGPNIPTGNISIGKGVNPFSLSGSDQMNIGNFLWANTINGSSVGGYFSGNLGVGYYNPTSTLHVGGDIRMDYTANGNHWRRYIDAVNDYNFEYNGTLLSYIQDTDGSYNIFSDRRLKKNVRSMDFSISEKVLKLNPVNYTYITDKTQTNQYGFIAQEVQKLFPELVNKKESKGETYLSLNYQAFGVLAIKTIQEQQKEIDTLKEEISELKKLEARIKKLEMN